MFWSTANFRSAVAQLMPRSLRSAPLLPFARSLASGLSKIHTDTLYKMQHDGRTIYLEKVLNEWFPVLGYDTQNHETTKHIYIDDLAEGAKLYIHLEPETEVEFIEDEGADSDLDLFLDADGENETGFSFIIFIPDLYVFEELQVRALVDSYRYFGKKYTIQTYTL